MKTHILDRETRLRLKEPVGQLIKGDPDKTIRLLQEIVLSEKPEKIIVVGDSTTLSMVRHGVKAHLYIVDNQIMRRKIKPISIENINVVRVKNPPGTITAEASEAIYEAINSPKRSKIIVEGEEDLLTLPAVKFAPTGSIVVYGQPKIGLVVVKVNDKKRREITSLMSKMGHE